METVIDLSEQSFKNSLHTNERTNMSTIDDDYMFVASTDMPALLPKRKLEIYHKCLLPGCENMTSHNGGYCSAEHCRLHRKGISFPPLKPPHQVALVHPAIE